MHKLSRYYCGSIGCLLFLGYGLLKKNIMVCIIGVNAILYHILFPVNFYVCMYDILYNFIVYIYFFILRYKSGNKYIIYLFFPYFMKWLNRDMVTLTTQHNHIFEVHLPGLLILMYLL